MPLRRYVLLAAIDAIAVAALLLFIVACNHGGGDSPAPQQQASNDPHSQPPTDGDEPCDETRLAARDMDGVCRDHEMGALAVVR